MSDNFRRHPVIAETPEAYASAIIIEIFKNLDEIQFTKAEKINKTESESSPTPAPTCACRGSGLIPKAEPM